MAKKKSDILKKEPLHIRIAEKLRKQIKKEYAPGDKIESESKLGKRFGVCVPTIREALSSLALEGLVERHHGSGTYVAERDNSKHVAIFSELDFLYPTSSWFYLQVIRQLRGYLGEYNIESRMYMGHTRQGEKPSDADCPELIEALQKQKVSAVFSICTTDLPAYLTPALLGDIPIISGVEQYPYRILHDYKGLIEKGVTLLAEQGCQTIAFMGSSMFKDIFVNSALKHGFTKENILVETKSNPSVPEECLQGFQKLWSNAKKPDGILFGDDNIYFNIEPFLLGNNIKPADLKIVSHSNKGDSRIPFIPCILLQFDPDFFARKTADLINDILTDKPGIEPTILLSCSRKDVSPRSYH